MTHHAQNINHIEVGIVSSGSSTFDKGNNQKDCQGDHTFRRPFEAIRQSAGVYELTVCVFISLGALFPRCALLTVRS